jgi:hypothetical protein
MAKHVKGTLFLDYVRMIKKRKDTDWSKYLEPEDRKIIEGQVLPSNWYTLDSYQRMGLAVFNEIAGGDPQVVREWGKRSLEELTKVYQNLVQEGEPIKSLERFQTLRARFFDFEGLGVEPRPGNRVHVMVDMAFEAVAEEAYAYQMAGSFERLLELSGAKNVKWKFHQKAWEGDQGTVIDLSWE